MVPGGREALGLSLVALAAFVTVAGVGRPLTTLLLVAEQQRVANDQ